MNLGQLLNREFFPNGIVTSDKKSYCLNMIGQLFLLFTVVPLIELYILIYIGGYIGALNTILLVIMTALVGAALARHEGLRTLRQISDNLSQGIMPAEELVDAFLIFGGGVMLVTPGILTDLVALGLLIPFIRTQFKRWLRRKFDRMVASGNIRLHVNRRGPDEF